MNKEYYLRDGTRGEMCLFILVLFYVRILMFDQQIDLVYKLNNVYKKLFIQSYKILIDFYIVKNLFNKIVFILTLYKNLIYAYYLYQFSIHLNIQKYCLSSCL
jgi:hypothetical protein